MWKYRSLIGVVSLGLMLTVFVGCSKVTAANYDKINTGMTVSEVEEILGKGTEKAGVAGAVGKVAGSGKILTWGDENKSITVTFANGKVAAKAKEGI